MPEIEVPYGLRIAPDCRHLEEDPAEREVLLSILESIVQDHQLARAAESLNLSGYRNRRGAKWSAADVFDLLPRIIEAGSTLVSSDEWRDRRRRILASL